jgi:L-threonylcarbamoyladenylate synthase
MIGSNPLPHAGIIAATESAITRAAEILRAGGIVALPTETVYGLAADASNVSSVAQIYRTKGRPDFNPLIVHVPDLETAMKLAQFDERADILAAAFWPGPLTMVLPLLPQANIAKAVTAGLDTIAIRCPAHPVMQAVLSQSGLCLAAPSANRSGGISPTRARHVASSLGDNAPMILDGGACQAGLESTIVALRSGGWQILREGPITQQQLTAVLGGEAQPVSDGKIEAPGQLAAHYAPKKSLRLNATAARDGEWMIGFGAIAGDDNLSLEGDLPEAASRLFDALHIADASSCPAIAVAPIPNTGIGAAICDRLKRAASVWDI